MSETLFDTRYFEGEDPEFVKGLAKMFVANAPQTLQSIKECIQGGSFTQVHEQAHKVKPHFALFGRKDLSEKLQQIEVLAFQSPEKDKLNQLIDDTLASAVPMFMEMKKRFELY